MKIIAINGGPRPNHNTGTLLKSAVDGAISKGAEVEVVDLYKLNYRGCTACFSCKRKGNKYLHDCAINDELTAVLEKIKTADAAIFASPIYFFDITGEMRSFLERLLFPLLPYDTEVKDRTYYPKVLRTAFLYTMGVSESVMTERLKPMENFISQMFRFQVQTLLSCHAYPFVDDYSNYEATASNLQPLLKHRDEEFPNDCEKAFRIGEDLAVGV